MTRPARPSPSCRKVLLDLSRALDGDLSTPRCDAIAAHLESCEDCARAASALRSTIAACRSTAARPIPAAVKSRARKRIKALLDR